MKQSYLEKAVEVVRHGSGQPQFINMDAAMARSLVGFASRGVTLNEAVRFPLSSAASARACKARAPTYL